MCVGRLVKAKSLSVLIFVTLSIYIVMLNVNFIRFSFFVSGFSLYEVFLISNLVSLAYILIKGLFSKGTSGIKFVLIILGLLFLTTFFTPQLIS